MRTLICALVLASLAVFSHLSVAADDSKPEPGYTLLFNGKNLDGWKTKTGESLDGETEAYMGRFKVVDGILVIDPKVKGDRTIYTTRQFGDNAHIKFEFLPGPGCNNDLYFRGHKFDIRKGKGGVENFKEGEWHDFEIISKGDTVEFKCKGESQRIAKVKVPSSPLGLRAEFNAIQYRNIRAK